MIFNNLFKKMIAGGAIVSALLGGLALAPAVVARAATLPPPAAAARTAKADPTRLQNLFKAEQKLQTAQGQRLDATSKVISNTQQMIDKQNGLGKNTDALVQALSDYQAAVTNATSLHQTAQGIIDAHAGFDVNGVVTDAAAARTTVTDAGRAQRELRLTMNQAAFDLRARVRLWRLSQR